MKKWFIRRFPKVAATLVTLFWNAFVFASGTATTFGDMGKNFGNNATGVSEGALKGFGTFGIVLIGIGIMKFRQNQGQGEGQKEAWSFVGVGAGLFSIVAIIVVFNTSFFGTDTAKAVRDKIISL